ncbi:MAG: sulfite exporter TauE/SafE family protein [Actinomycetota bacterium]
MRTLVAAVIGFASGIASGAFGIGGALLSTPGIRWALDAPALIAVGTTLPVIIPTALTGLVAYVREELVDIRSAAVAAASGGAFAIVGALTTQVVSGEALLVTTAALIFVLSIRMLPSAGALRPPRFKPTIPVLLVVGSVSGFVAGLLGVGGGVILVPVLTVLLRFPVKSALGTSLAVVAAQAVPGTLTHALIGNIDWSIAGGLVLGVIPGAWIGSRIAVAAEDRKLRTVVALAMAALAVAFAVTEIRALSQ